MLGQKAAHHGMSVIDRRRITSLVVLALAALSPACAGTPHRVTAPTAAPRQHIVGNEFQVVGRPDGTGDAYDDTLLFERANAAVQTHRCDAALADYDLLLQRFPASRLIQATQYNRGVCLQSMARNDDAVAAFRAAATTPRDPDVVRDAWFRLAVIGEATSNVPLVIEATDAILAIPNVSIPDRVEAYARRAAARLAAHDRDGATHEADQAVGLAPTPEAVSALQDDTYIAQAKFVLAEATRQRAADIEIRVGDANLEQAIERRVQLVVHAHVQFNEAIRVGNPHWAAACGYSIGQMYRALYESIVNAPVPSDWDEHAIGIYRQRTSQRLRPLLQGALRAWEATLDMARRNGISDNDWARRTDAQITELRAFILNGGVPPASTPAAASASP
jgi:tetratricopeptide (TPR) repeat protein